jgi:transcriptional regulator with XRE-family HTH domain
MMSADDSAAALAREIGERIRTLRLSRNLTQEQLAESADISVSFLSMIERGERTPHLVTLQALATALGDRIGDFFDCEGAAAAD